MNRKMVRTSVYIPERVLRAMRKNFDVNWSHVAREAFESRLRELRESSKSRKA